MEMSAAKCPHCGSDNTRFRTKRNNWICDDCDFVFTTDDVVVTSNDLPAERKKQRRVFISYGHDCASFVNRIKKDLELKGYEVWVDSYEIKSGDDWRNAIVSGILESQAVLAFLSTHSLRQGGVCLDELAIAVGCNRNIIRTCLMEKEALEMIPSTISGIEFMDLTSWNLLDGPQLEQWYQEKFQEILHNIDSAIEFQEDPLMKELELRLRPCMVFENQYIELRKPFTERIWLANLVDHWIDNPSSRTLLLTAYPGGGKSAFCAHYFHFHPLSICLTMCSQNLHGVDETRQILKNIAFQIAYSSIGYRKNLISVLNNNIGVDLASIDLKSLFNLLICTPFQLEIDGGHAPVIIVVDGVDSLDQGEQNTLSELFSNHISTLPKFVSIMFSSRHSGNVINGFTHTARIDINPDSEETAEDIERFLREHSPSISGTTSRHIAESCHGSFLYASFLSAAIKEGCFKIDDHCLFLPQLQGLYYHSMQHIFSDNSLYDTYWRPLALIIAWGGEMPATLLQEYMHWLPFEYSRFYSRLMIFLHHRVDTKGNQWIGVVYPSFVSWLTEESDTNVYRVPLPTAFKELANALWTRFKKKETMTNLELVKMRDILKKAGYDDKLFQLRHDDATMQLLLTRIKDYGDDPRDFQTILQLTDFCQELANALDSDEARMIAKGELPFLQIQHDFISSDYGAMLKRYADHANGIAEYCSLEQQLHMLYMVSTGYDLTGQRREAVEGFTQLCEKSHKAGKSQYEFYALIGLLWNDHFTNVDEGQNLVNRLNTSDFEGIKDEDKLLRKLMVARFMLSTGNPRAAFDDFLEVMTEESGFVWRCNTISARIQMLLIESLVAAYDNCEYLKGIDLGQHIYSHIGNSTSIAACYCASWMAMNYIQCGCYSEAEEMISRAEQKNERLQIVGPSKWMTMHLKSVRSFLCSHLNDLKSAVDLLWEVVDLAKETNDTWVLGDAYFDLFCHSWFDSTSTIDKQDLPQLYLKLKAIADKSDLPHLKHKTLLMRNMLMPDKDEALLLYNETQKHILEDALASTDIVTALYLCLHAYNNMFPGSKEAELLKKAILDKSHEIDEKNPGINYSKRNKIVQLITENQE